MLCLVLQEVLACGVLLPLINQLSDPDYINQFVIWMVGVGAHTASWARVNAAVGLTRILLYRFATPAVTTKPS